MKSIFRHVQETYTTTDDTHLLIAVDAVVHCIAAYNSVTEADGSVSEDHYVEALARLARNDLQSFERTMLATAGTRSNRPFHSIPRDDKERDMKATLQMAKSLYDGFMALHEDHQEELALAGSAAGGR